MEAFKEVGVAMWATVSVPLLTITVILAYFVRRRSLSEANKKLLVAMGVDKNEEAEYVVEHNGPFPELESRFKRLVSGLWRSLTGWNGGGESDGVGKKGRVGWGLEKFRSLGRLRGRHSVGEEKDLEMGPSSPEPDRIRPAQ